MFKTFFAKVGYILFEKTNRCFNFVENKSNFLNFWNKFVSKKHFFLAIYYLKFVAVN